MHSQRLQRFVLTLMVVTVAVSVHADLRLQGSLLAPSTSWIHELRPAATVTIDGGALVVRPGWRRGVTDQRTPIPTLEVEGAGLIPSAAYLVMLGDRPFMTVTADDRGALTYRLAAGPATEGWSSMPEAMATRLSGALAAVRVVGLSTSTVATAAADATFPAHSKTDDPVHYESSTPLCGTGPAGAGFGFAMIHETPDFAVFSVEADGLEPATDYTITADGVLIATVTSDNWGTLWLDAATEGAPIFGPMPPVPLPVEVLPLAGVARVEVALDDVVILAGDFTAPCLNPPPPPVESGSIELCGGDHGRFGHFEWSRFEDGREQAFLFAQLEVDVPFDLQFVLDGTLVADLMTEPGGIVVAEFSSDPRGDALPLPAEVLPLSGVVTASVSSGSEELLHGVAGGQCDGGGPPTPVASASTPLCPLLDAGGQLWDAAGEATWVEFDSGDEELELAVHGLEPETAVELVVDGTVLGTFTSDPAGHLMRRFSTMSHPNSPNLPLPEAIRPVSMIDQVEARVDGERVARGSFSEPCSGWEPPPHPVAGDRTTLCPPALASTATGVVGWTEWSSGDEDLFVSAHGLPPGVDLELFLDGLSLGHYQTGQHGGLELQFSTFEVTIPEVMPLPDDVRPLSALDRVALRSSDGVVVAGSFVTPCDDRPEPVAGAGTPLCPPDPTSARRGEVHWQIWSDGTEDVMIHAHLAPADAIDLVIDGQHLGVHDAGLDGELFLYFSSADTLPPDVIPLPDWVRPVSAIDRVSLAVDDAVVLAGSFSDPCVSEVPPVPVLVERTGLCPRSSDDTHGEVARTVYENGDEDLRLRYGPDEAGALRRLVFDGAVVVETNVADSGFIEVLLASYEAPPALPLPEELQPVTAIDLVEVQMPDGEVVAAGSFSQPCHGPSPPEIEGDVTSMCPIGDLPAVGVAGWVMSSVDGVVIEEMFEVLAFGLDRDDALTVEVDGEVVGNLAPIPWWPGGLVLDLGSHGPLPIPESMHPLAEIDHVRVLDATGEAVLQASFASPCAGGPSGDGPGTGGRMMPTNHHRSTD